MTKTADRIAISMSLVECDGRRILAGNDGDLVYVLEKHDTERFTLHLIPITASDKQLRSFMTSAQCAAVETIVGIRLATRSTKATRKRSKAKQ